MVCIIASLLQCYPKKSHANRGKSLCLWLLCCLLYSDYIITGEPIGEVRAVSDMHQRKAEMARQADAFIALPGGYGTLEELLEIITWAQLGIHSKPVGLLNVDGFYNSLLSFIDKAVDEGFISPKARRIIVSAPTAKELVRELEEHVPERDEVVSKLVWEERLSYVPESEVAM
ncbi:hypothetical protein ACSQ67_015872 [Phaseolus vulgaris]